MYVKTLFLSCVSDSRVKKKKTLARTVKQQQQQGKHKEERTKVGRQQQKEVRQHSYVHNPQKETDYLRTFDSHLLTQQQEEEEQHSL